MRRTDNDRRRFLLLYPLPALLLLLWAVLPLVLGQRTLFLRDAFNTHLEMKWTQAEAMRRGELPLIDAWRSGGQPHLGNPNTVPLYPSNLLYLVAPPLWAFNAHFWGHWLLAPFAVWWLGRAWGLSREAAWVAGTCYAGSGFFLSTLNLYNLVAGAALAPALAAALLELTAPDAAKRGRRLVIAALVWTLLLLGGDPMTAAAALGIGLSAVLFRHAGRGREDRAPDEPAPAPAHAAEPRPGADSRREAPRPAARRRSPARPAARWPAVLAALGLGTALAAPQLVEFLRVVSLSFRGHWGYSTAAAGAGSWNPVNMVEWLLPFVFGLPDLAFWGRRFHGGQVPLLYTLYPGLLALALVAVAGRPRRRGAWWAWALVAAGLFLALGRHNPVFGLLLELPGADLLRLPVKLWVLVATGGALLCGLGAERLLRDPRRGRLVWALGALFLVFLAAWLLLGLRPAGLAAALAALLPAGSGAGAAEMEQLRWAGLCLLSMVLLGGYLLVWRLVPRRRVALGLLASLHLAAQLFLLRPVVPQDEAVAYLAPPDLLAHLPEEARVVHGKAKDLFGPVTVPLRHYPDARPRWLQRQVFAELYPVAGILHGRRYELVVSPEGLDSFFTRATAQAVEALPDAARLRLLAASGVTHLLLGRELAPDAALRAEPVARRPGPGGDLFVYRLRGVAEEVQFTGRVRRSEHLNAALEALTDPAFDPRRDVVLAGGGEELDGAGGAVEVLSVAAESLHVRVEAASAGALAVQRSYLPIWRASVDGEPAEILVANLHRMAVELPPGSHEVRLWVDRRPFRGSLVVALAALAGLVAVARRYREGAPAG